MFIVVNVGCIECGVSSNIVGVFEQKVVADSIADTLQKTHSWREGGQNKFLVFPLPQETGVVHEEYVLS